MQSIFRKFSKNVFSARSGPVSGGPKFFLLALFLFIFSNIFFLDSVNVVLAAEEETVTKTIPSTGPSDKSIEAIGKLQLKDASGKNVGIIHCNTTANPKPCSPRDLFIILGKLGKLALYILIIGVGLGGIIIGAMYPFYGDKPEMLTRMKGIIKNFVIALVIIVLATSFVFAILKSLGGNATILDLIQKLLSTNLIENSYAAESVNLNETLQEVANQNSDRYPNFFGTKDPIILIHNLIKFLVNFIFIPMLVLALIWTGFLFIQAQGNDTKITEAKKWALRCAIGIVVAASATFLSDLFFKSLEFILNK